MNHDQLRIQALRSYELLDTPPHPSFDAVTRAAQIAFDAPISLISLVDEARQWFKSCIGLDVGETTRNVSFCSHAIGQFDVFVIPDATKDARFKDNPLVTGDPHIRFYAGAPLIDSEHYALGTLCVIDRKPRRFSDRDKELLASLGACAMNAITLHSQGALLRRAERLLQRYMDRDTAAPAPLSAIS